MSSQSDPVSNAVAYATLAVANGVGWLNGETAGAIVSFTTVLVFGGIGVYNRITKAIDKRWANRELLKVRIKLRAEQLEREAKAGTGEHVQL